MVIGSLIYQFVVFIQTCILCAVVDVVVFLCVDQICKVLLSNCQTLSEKRDIWLFESLVLFGLSSVVLVYHHWPLLLWVLALLTFVSATYTGRIDIAFYLNSLKNYWNEFSDQQESLRVSREEEVLPSGPRGPYKNQVSDDQCKEYLRQTGEIQINNENVVNTSAIGEGLKTLKYNEKKAKYELVMPPSQPQKTSTRALGSSADKTALRRRISSRSSEIVTAVAPDFESSSAPGILDHLESFGQTVWSALAPIRPTPVNVLPPGLPSNLNLCFLNSVMQCLARAPNLADELAEEVKSCRSQDPCKLALLDSLTEALQQLNEKSIELVDTAELCQAGAQINPDLLSRRRSRQSQQDACELLTWLMYEIHEAINDAGGRKSGADGDAMKKLKSVYGNLSESYMKVMKEECKQQIATAKGFTDVELPEMVQNLSNLEWITHRRNNCSVIDQLFTFQSIDLQMCSACNNTSANVQSMNILSLPIPNQQTPVSLTDCINNFTAAEQLTGRERLQCSNCQKQASQMAETPGVQTRQTRLRSQVLSPIQPPADTTAHQRMSFLASTPLPAANKLASRPGNAAFKTQPLSDGVRQCLLRRLPECLTIQLLRFSYDTSVKKVFKVHTPLTVPLSNTDMASLTYDAAVARDDPTVDSKAPVYSLYAFNLHVGGQNTCSGHYLAYCRGVDGCWYRSDDEDVTLVADIEAELRKPEVMGNLYLLFYRKEHETSS